MSYEYKTSYGCTPPSTAICSSDVASPQFVVMFLFVPVTLPFVLVLLQRRCICSHGAAVGLSDAAVTLQFVCAIRSDVAFCSSVLVTLPFVSSTLQCAFLSRILPQTFRADAGRDSFAQEASAPLKFHIQIQY